VLWETFSSFQLDNLQIAGRSLGMQLHPIEIGTSYDFSSAFMSAKRMRVDAVMVLLSPGFLCQEGAGRRVCTQS